MRSASVRFAYSTTSLRVDRVSIAFRSEKESVRRRDHTNFAPNSREKNLNFKFLKIFGAPRAQKLRELGQRGCANRRTSLQLFSESACVRMQDNARAQRRDDANFAQKSREKFAKLNFGNPARPAPKNCVHSANLCCAYSTTSLRVDRVSIAFRSEKESVQHRDHANFAPNSREKNFKVSEKFRRAARTKVS